jgi:hypothetical protein
VPFATPCGQEVAPKIVRLSSLLSARLFRTPLARWIVTEGRDPASRLFRDLRGSVTPAKAGGIEPIPAKPDAPDRLLADRSPVIVREIVHRPYDRAEAIVSTLVDAVMARPTNHDAIVEMVGAAELRVLDVMGLSAFRKLVRGPARLTNRGNWRSARCAEVLLPQQRQFLGPTRKFLRSLCHRLTTPGNESGHMLRHSDLA